MIYFKRGRPAFRASLSHTKKVKRVADKGRVKSLEDLLAVQYADNPSIFCANSKYYTDFRTSLEDALLIGLGVIP